MALGGLMLLGIALRVWLLAADRPAFLGFPDARAYLAAVKGPLFWNPYKPAGYPLLLRLVRLLTPHLTAAIAVQHVLGIATALLLFVTVARFLRTSWLALMPATVVLLSGSQLYLEHSALSDAPFTFVVTAALWCACATLAPDGGSGRRTTRASVWLAAAGALAAAGTLLRPVGIVLLPVLGVYALARPWGGWRQRMSAAASVLGAAVVIFAPYLVAQHAQTGQWGLSRASAEQFYGRVATFAQCRHSQVPAGARALCQSTPPSRRPNANWYLFDPASPLVRTFGTPGPSNPFDTDHAHYRYPPEKVLSTFDRAVVLNQPAALVLTTIQGMVKYIAPHVGPASMLEWDNSRLISELHDRLIENDAGRYVTLAYNTRAGYVRHGLRTLDAYARAATIEGPITAVLVLLMLAGWFLARGPTRTAAALFGWCTFLLALAPVLLLFYSSRYATPIQGPLAAGAAIGADQLILGFRGR